MTSQDHRKDLSSTGLDPGNHCRVLYVVNDLDVGGAQRVLLNQATHLDRSKFAPEVASLELIPRGALTGAFEEAGIPVHRLASKRGLPVQALPALDRLIRTRRPSVVHTHLAASGVLARWVAARRGVSRVITTCHNLSDWDELRTSPLRWADRRTLSLAHVVIAVSDAVRLAIERNCPRLVGRMVTIPNGVPLQKFRAAPGERQEVRSRLGYSSDDFVLGTLARLDPRKGLDTVIDALSFSALRHPRLRLLIVGDGGERSRLAARAESRGVAGRVAFVPYQIQVAPYLAAMDLFVAPSRTEGLGLAIIEALAAGVPVLASSVGGIPEVVEDGVCGRLLPPDDVKRWAAAIGVATMDHERMRRWREEAPQQAARFSIEASVESLARLYEDRQERAAAREAA